MDAVIRLTFLRTTSARAYKETHGLHSKYLSACMHSFLPVQSQELVLCAMLERIQRTNSVFLGIRDVCYVFVLWFPPPSLLLQEGSMLVLLWIGIHSFAASYPELLTSPALLIEIGVVSVSVPDLFILWPMIQNNTLTLTFSFWNYNSWLSKHQLTKPFNSSNMITACLMHVVQMREMVTKTKSYSNK